MALLVPSVGEAEMLTRILNGTDKLKIHLYTNNQTPAQTDVVTNYTEVATGGYAAIALSSTWTIGGTPTEADYPTAVTFNFSSGPVTVYGYYVTNNSGTILMWAEKFSDGPYNIPNGGGSIQITPKIQLV